MARFSTRNKGFVTLEVILGIVLLTIVAIAAGITVVKTNQAIAHNRTAKKAAMMGQMVLEQYKAYSASNFNVLDTYNQADQPIEAFLDPSSSNGFQNPGRFRITTTASYNDNRSSCTVVSSITWQDGGGAHAMVFREVYVEKSPLNLGQKATVYVKLPCGSFTDDQDIINNCPGIPNVKIYAPSEANEMINAYGITDGNGEASLSHIKISSNTQTFVPFKAVAPAGSNFWIRRNLSTFATGYYKVNTYVMEDSSSTYTGGTTVKLLFKNFRMLGSVSGNISPPTYGAWIRLSSDARVVDNGSLSACLSLTTDSVMENNETLCRVQALDNGGGTYEFNNVWPENNGFSIAAHPGLIGTLWKSHTTDYYSSDYVRRWSGSDWKSADSWNYLTLPPKINMSSSLNVIPASSVQFTLKKDNSPLTYDSNVVFKAAFMCKKENEGLNDVDMPSAGQVAVWTPDLISELKSPNQSFTIHNNNTALRLYLNNWAMGNKPGTGPGSGYYGGQKCLPIVAVSSGISNSYKEGLYGRTTWYCDNVINGNGDCTGQGVINVDLTMTPGYELKGSDIKIMDKDGNPFPDYVFKTPFNLGFEWGESGPSDNPTGKFTMHNFWPDIHPETTIDGIPARKVRAEVTNTNPGFPANISVKTKLNWGGGPPYSTVYAGQAPERIQVVEAGAAVWKYYTTDDYGDLGPLSLYLPSTESSSYYVNGCDVNNLKCEKIYTKYSIKPSACDDSGHTGYCKGVWLWNAKEFTTGDNNNFYYCYPDTHVYDGVTSPYGQLCTLRQYRVWGKVVTSSDQTPISGVQVKNLLPNICGAYGTFDANNVSYPCKTDGSGSYNCAVGVPKKNSGCSLQLQVGLDSLTVGVVTYKNPQFQNASVAGIWDANDKKMTFDLPTGGGSDPLTPVTGIELNWTMDKTVGGSQL